MSDVQHDPTLALASATDSSSAPPDRCIGAYRLIEILGEGGMGTVYLAEQREPVRRFVALKIMRASLIGPGALARFSAERQALARLSHPNIAMMYDGGATDAGFPYFAMERVEGLPVIEYCDTHRLSIRERVDLFIEICRGVQHAHQKGVMHRDLKPSNVLVADVEGRPVPKIIDFGIAKAVDQPLTEATALVTGHGIIGTPAYMSPEALSGDDLDTRTDVYSLGVCLYELVAGVRPHDIGEVNLVAAIRIVIETDTPSPRHLFDSLDAKDRNELAALRHEDEHSMASVLSGDLAWIARKATARDREERYGSAADLAADLVRYQNHEAVLASPPSLRYRAAKFARRHRLGVAGVSILILTIIGGITGTTIGMLRAQRARTEAVAVSAFLTDLLESASPWHRRNETTVRELLEEAAARISHELQDQPSARAELLQTIGSSEFHLGHLDSAERLLREALRLRRVTDGADSAIYASVLNDLGLVRKHQGHLDDAEELLRDSLVIRRKAWGNVHGSVARGLFDLATILAMRGKNAEAEAAFRESLVLRETLFASGAKDIDAGMVALTMNGLGGHLMRTGNLREAESLIRRSLDIRRRAGDTGYAYALSLLDLGAVLAKQNRLAEAEELDRQGLAALKAFVEPGDHRIEEAGVHLAQVLRAQGKSEEANALQISVTATTT